MVLERKAGNLTLNFYPDRYLARMSFGFWLACLVGPLWRLLVGRTLSHDDQIRDRRKTAQVQIVASVIDRSSTQSATDRPSESFHAKDINKCKT
jgi:hypothetical protein